MSGRHVQRRRAAVVLAALVAIVTAGTSVAGIRTVAADGESDDTPAAVVHLTAKPTNADVAPGATISPRMPTVPTGHLYGATGTHVAVYGASLVRPHVQPYGGSIVRGGGAGSPIFELTRLDRARPLWPIVHALANQMGVDPALAMGVIETESAFRQQAISPKGAVGLMQIMPGTAERLGIDARDPLDNLFGGVRYLSWLLQRYQGNEAYAIAGYNAGEHAVDTYGGIPPYAETTAYVTRVLEAKRRWTLLTQSRL